MTQSSRIHFKSFQAKIHNMVVNVPHAVSHPKSREVQSKLISLQCPLQTVINLSFPPALLYCLIRSFMTKLSITFHDISLHNSYSKNKNKNNKIFTLSLH